MKRLRMLRCLRLLALALLLAGVGLGPLAVVPTPAILADEGKDESGQGNNDGDKDEGKDDDKGEDKDDDKDEGNGPERPVEPAAAYRVEVDCAYAEVADETTCTFTGEAPPEAKDVSHVDLPASEVCTDVVGGDHEYVDPDPNTRVVGYKSRGSEGVFTLVMTGEVTIGGTATYWFKTGDGVFPATGPGLRCGEAVAQQAVPVTEELEVEETVASDEPAATTEADLQITVEFEAETATTGEIVVQTYACGAMPADPFAFDWYGECEPGVEGVPFTLEAKEGTRLPEARDGATDAEGTLQFEALEPATYHLQAVDAVWCYAESDSVDERGDLVIEAGQRVNVWIFFCGEEAVAGDAGASAMSE